MRILAISTSTEYCSAALQIDSELLERDLPAERAAGEHILELVDALLAEAAIGFGALDAIAFGRGPGAFTGVRLAASVTQGLAASAGLPVIPVSDLQAVAQRAFGLAPTPERLLICQDARMHEVYWAWFEFKEAIAQPISQERVSAPTAVVALSSPAELRGSGGGGSGFDFYPELRDLYDNDPGRIQLGLFPRAREIAQLALARGLEGAHTAADAQPVYVRDQVAHLPAALT
jgi:tRNA threonylcarbamoyladenosine biosynthesis protein TsaB